MPSSVPDPLGSDHPADHDGLDPLSFDECQQRLASTPVGRIAFVVDGQPIVRPVNFAWIDGAIVFRTGAGLTMSTVVEGGSACFEVDDWDADARSGWSVVVKGTASEITDWAEKEALEQIGLVPWHKGEWRSVWVKVTPVKVTGRTVG